MKKLRLDVDALTVESFATDAGLRGAGTVRANAVTPSACPTDAYDCDPNTIGASCGIRCTSCKWAVADADGVAAAGTVDQDKSVAETCVFYTCATCTTADPAYCNAQTA